MARPNPRPSPRTVSMPIPPVLLIVLLAGIALGVWYTMTGVETVLQPNPVTQPQPQGERQSATPRGSLRPESRLLGLTTPPAADDLLAVAPDDVPLPHEPANLAPPPWPGAVRQGGRLRRSDSLVEESSVWEVPHVMATQIIEHYGVRVEELGFHAMPSPAPGGADTINRIYARGDRNQEVMVVRVRDTIAGARVTLWFRYPMTDAR